MVANSLRRAIAPLVFRLMRVEHSPGRRFTSAAPLRSGEVSVVEVQGPVVISRRRHEALLESEIVHFSRALEPHPITLQQILGYNDTVSLRMFLLEELPIRFARRLLLLESLPDWERFPHMRVIRALYTDAFRRLRMVSANDADNFRTTLQNIKRRNSNMLVHVVRGVRSMKAADICGLTDQQVNDFLDQFLKARIGTDILSSQYLAITRPSGPTSVINPQCDPVQVVHGAAADAVRLCKYHYDKAPPVDVIDVGQVRFPFIPQYLNYIMFELLKNSLRAVTERYGDSCSEHPVKVVVCGDAESVVIRVSDDGGGIALADVPKAWSYLYTTAKAPVDDAHTSISDFDSEEGDVAPMAGFGCGLPLSRNYASYVGGSLEINSMPLHGVDAYVYLNRLGNSIEDMGQKAGLPSRGFLLR